MSATPVKTIADHAEEYASLSKSIKELNDLLKTLEDARKKCANEIIAALDAQRVGMAAVGKHTFRVSTKKHPNVSDWEAFNAYIKEHDALYLLQRRISTKAIEELAALEDIPGISFYEGRELSITTRR